VFKAVRSSLEGNDWQTAPYKIERSLRAQNFVSHVENDRALPVQPKAECVIRHHASSAQFIRLAHMVDTCADIGPQGPAWCNGWVNRNERAVELAAQPGGVEAAKAGADDNSLRLQLQPCCAWCSQPRDYPDTVSGDLHFHAVITLRHLAEGITPGTESDALYQVGHIAHICARQADLLRAPRRDAVLAQITKLGLEYDPDQVDDDRVAALSIALDEGLASNMRAQSMKITELEESVAEIKEKTQAASESEDYTLLGELAPKGKIEKEALGAARAAHSELVDSLKRLVSAEPDDSDAVLEDILSRISDTANERTDQSDAQDVLTADLFNATDNGVDDDLDASDDDDGSEFEIATGADASVDIAEKDDQTALPPEPKTYPSAKPAAEAADQATSETVNEATSDAGEIEEDATPSPEIVVGQYPSGLAAVDAYFGIQFQGASSPMRFIL